MPEKVTTRQMIVEALNKAGRWPLAISSDNTRHFGNRRAIVVDDIHERDNPRLAFTFEHAINRPFSVRDERVRRERGTVSSNTDKAVWKGCFGLLGEVNDFRDVGEVVARESNEIRPPFGDKPAIVLVPFNLKICEPNRMAGPSGCLCHQFEAERLKPQKHARIE